MKNQGLRSLEMSISLPLLSPPRSRALVLANPGRGRDNASIASGLVARLRSRALRLAAGGADDQLSADCLSQLFLICVEEIFCFCFPSQLIGDLAGLAQINTDMRMCCLADKSDARSQAIFPIAKYLISVYREGARALFGF